MSERGIPFWRFLFTKPPLYPEPQPATEIELLMARAMNSVSFFKTYEKGHKPSIAMAQMAVRALDDAGFEIRPKQ